MSKIKIEGNSGGSGTFTIQAPNSDTDATITFPTATGSLLTSGDIGTNVLAPDGDGSGLTGISSVVQKVAYHSWDTYQLISAAASTNFYTCTDSEFTYTPVGANKLIVMCSPMAYSSAYYAGIALFKDGSIINASTAGGVRNTVHANIPYEIYANSSQPFVVEIDLASADAITFDLRVRSQNSSSSIVFNRAGYHTGDPNGSYNVSTVSSITVYEVAA